MITNKELLYKFTIRNNLLMFIIILAFAVILRIYNLGKYAFWYDEAIVALGEEGFSDLFLNPLVNITKFSYPLFWYSFTSGSYWQNLFGYSEFALRMPSVIFSLLDIIIVYLFARDFFGINVAKLASFLLAISPLHIYYAQEFTHYAAISFLSLLSAYMLFKIINNLDKKIYWVIYSISSILNLYFSYITLMTLFVFMGFFVLNIKNNKELFKRFLIFHAIIFIFIIPCLINIFTSVRYALFFANEFNVVDFFFWSERVSWKNIVFTFKNFSISYNTSFYTLLGFFTTIIFIAFFIYGNYQFWKKKNNLFLLCYIFTPCFILFLVSQLKACYAYRYLFHLLPFYIIGVSCGIIRSNKKISLIFIGLISILTLFGLRNYYQNYLDSDFTERIGVLKKRNKDIIDAVKYLSDNFKYSDIVFHTCRSTIYPLKFYTKKYSNTLNLIREVNNGRLLELNNKKELVRIDRVSAIPAAINIFPNFKVATSSRVWLIFAAWPPIDDFQRDEDVDGYEVVEQFKKIFHNLESKRFKDFIIYFFINEKKEINR